MSKPPKIPQDHYLEKWKTTITMWDNEANRFWTRNNIFLLLNGALIAIITAVPLSQLFGALIPGVGIVMAYLWIRVNQRGVFYLDRWKPIIEDLERQTGIEVIRRLPSYKKQREASASTYMRCAVFLFLVVYICFLVLALLGVSIRANG